MTIIIIIIVIIIIIIIIIIIAEHLSTAQRLLLHSCASYIKAEEECVKMIAQFEAIRIGKWKMLYVTQQVVHCVTAYFMSQHFSSTTGIIFMISIFMPLLRRHNGFALSIWVSILNASLIDLDNNVAT